jgi:hypothetical protein
VHAAIDRRSGTARVSVHAPLMNELLLRWGT